VRIAIDVMGGDHAPDAILAGCLDAVSILDDDDILVLIGDEKTIAAGIDARGLRGNPQLEIEPTTEVIGMAEPPVTALRSKKDSSIVRMGELGGRKAGDKSCEVIISAGNTGACVASAQMSMRRLHGVHRPGIAITMPTFHGPVVLCDVGANPEPKPMHLHQYGHMAAVYAKRVIGIERPRVALLSIGGEEAKGTPIVKDTHRLMAADPNINYLGYIEGRELFEGKAEVVVCEGFTGNVVLKLCEGLSAGLFKLIVKEIMSIDPTLAEKFQPVIKSLYAKHDYHEYGGAPLLGANGICMICHGSSEARTIVSAVKAAKSYAAHHVNDAIVEALAEAEQHVAAVAEELA
jgi:glycerol-3-phosphate acyltransferase PlsX